MGRAFAYPEAEVFAEHRSEHVHRSSKYRSLGFHNFAKKYFRSRAVWKISVDPSHVIYAATDQRPGQKPPYTHGTANHHQLIQSPKGPMGEVRGRGVRAAGGGRGWRRRPVDPRPRPGAVRHVLHVFPRRACSTCGLSGASARARGGGRRVRADAGAAGAVQRPAPCHCVP